MTLAWQGGAIAAIRKYRWQFSGMVAQVIQRASGLLLLLYLFVHVRTVRTLSDGPTAFNQAIGQFKNPFFRLLEIALLGMVILHALNGIRITLLDLGIGLKRQRQLFWIWAVGGGLLIFLTGAIPLFVWSVIRR